MGTTFKNGLAKHPSGHYHYCFRINGTQFKGSTRATDLATARKVLEEKRRQVLNDECGIKQIPTLLEIRTEWLRVQKPVFSTKHWTDVESVSRLWINPTLGNRRLDRITNGDVYQVRSKMLEAGRSPVTVNDMLKILKLLGNFAVKQGLLKVLPFKVEFLKVQKRPRPTVPASRVQEFLSAVDQAAKNPHVGVMLRVMVGLGLRESEVRGMRWEWFDLENQTYTVGKAKNKQARVLPVPEWVLSAIHTMPKTISPWVFPAEDGNPHRPQFCKKALGRVCAKLGLGNVTQHRLRASFASMHAEAGTPLPEIKELLGHQNIETTLIYVETSMAALRRSQDALSQKLGLA